MKYISLFSGIGGFELAIQDIYPEAACIGYSEIDKRAINVYEHHFPGHINLGNICNIKDEDILDLVSDGCDLIVGGFPCKNLSSLASFAGDHSGLEGSKSGLFYMMLHIITLVQSVNPNVKYIIENNSSMPNKHKDEITRELSKLGDVFTTKMNASEFGVQTRRRIFWTSYKTSVKIPEVLLQKWDDILEPMEIVKDYAISEKCIGCFNRTLKSKRSLETLRYVSIDKKSKLSRFFYEKKTDDTQDFITRWQLSFISDMTNIKRYPIYPVGKSRPIITSAGTNNIIIDRRFGNEEEFIVRKITPIEKERLFYFPDNWTLPAKSKTGRGVLLGNTVVVEMVRMILDV